MSTQTTLTATCLCGHSSFPLPTLTSALPLPADFCHCTSCRHGTGALFFGAADHPGPLPAAASTSLSKHAFSPRVDVYFCPTCGTWMFWHHREMGYFGVACGVLDQPETQFKYSKHMFLGDTRDGGAGEWVRRVGGVELERFGERTGSEVLPLGWKERGGRGQAREEKLHAHCLCRGVEFYITRPDDASRDLSISSPGTKECWWLNAAGLYYAKPCACTSCRLASGVELFSWAYIPNANIKLPDGEALRFDFGTLKSYNSSPGRTRYFCGGCGATVFWKGEGRPGLLDVAVGLLDAAGGARAEEWLGWGKGDVLSEWGGLNRALMEAADEGLAAYVNSMDGGSA